MSLYKIKKLSSNYLKFWVNFVPYLPILIFIRIWFITFHFGSINKNLNPVYIFIGILAILAILSYIINFSLKQFLQEFKYYLILLFFLNTANIYSVVNSEFKLFSFLFWMQLVIGYTLFLGLGIFFKLLKAKRQKNTIIYKIYKILAFIVAYDILLMFVQFITIAFFKEQYLKFPILVKRILFNGYFLNKVPPQRWNLSTYFLRPTGLLGDTNVNAMFILIVFFIFIATYTLLNLKKSKTSTEQRLTDLIIKTFILFPIGFLFSLSRSAFLGFTVVFLVFIILILLQKKSKNLAKRIVILLLKVTIFVFALLIGVYFMFKPFNSYVNNIVNIKQDRSVTLHLFYMKIAFKLAKKHDYKPWGLGTFPRIFTLKVNPKVKEGATPHSTYATVTMEQGALGLICYFISFALIWVLVLKNLIYVLQNNNLDLYSIFSAIWGFGFLFLTISTIFYYGFWDISTWLWTGNFVLNYNKNTNGNNKNKK